jgi:hypothetical protein
LRIVLCVIAALFVAMPLAATPAKKKDASVSRCSFDHYPVAVGNVSEYRSVSKQLDGSGKVIEQTSNSYTEEIIAVDEASYKARTTMEGNASEATWLCGEEGIAFQYDQYPGTKISSSGVSVPATLEVGSSWSFSFTMEGPGINQTTTTVNRVTGREMVSVPVGSFEAWRVESESRTESEGNEPTVLRGTMWYATAVGLLKSTFTVPMEMGDVRGVESITELVKQTTK